VGRSESQCNLYINDDKVEIRDATDLWGKMHLKPRKFLKMSG